MLLLPSHSLTTLDTIHCMSAERLLTGLPDAFVDLIVTSPPYDKLRTYNGHHTFDFPYIARQSYRVLKPGGVLVWVVGDATVDGSETLTSFRQAIEFVDGAGFKMHDTMIYHRYGRFPEINRYWQEFEYMFVLSKDTPNNFNPVTRRNKNGGDTFRGTSRNPDGSMFIPVGRRKHRRIKTEGAAGNVWFIDAGFMRTTKDIIAFEHDAIFPEDLAERHILTWSNPGDIVLDYFAGSGTTLKMARNNGRRFIGGDISSEYVELCERRLSMPFTPKMFLDVPSTAQASQVSYGTTGKGQSNSQADLLLPGFQIAEKESCDELAG